MNADIQNFDYNNLTTNQYQIVKDHVESSNVILNSEIVRYINPTIFASVLEKEKYLCHQYIDLFHRLSISNQLEHLDLFRVIFETFDNKGYDSERKKIAKFVLCRKSCDWMIDYLLSLLTPAYLYDEELFSSVCFGLQFDDTRIWCEKIMVFFIGFGGKFNIAETFSLPINKEILKIFSDTNSVYRSWNK